LRQGCHKDEFLVVICLSDLRAVVFLVEILLFLHISLRFFGFEPSYSTSRAVYPVLGIHPSNLPTCCFN
jgi:hypothetical protein